jgi:hypothetical protein
MARIGHTLSLGKSNLDSVLSRFKSVRRVKGGWQACCPAHDDRHASLSISVGDDGRVLLHCHAGCDTSAVLAAVGMQLADLFPPTGAAPSRSDKLASGGRKFATAKEAVAELERQHGKRSAVWIYRDAAGNPVGLVVRWDLSDGNKDIRPVSRHPDGWRIGAMPELRPLYRLPEILAAPEGAFVFVVEGEKCADVVASLGFYATTSAGGANAADKTDWNPLRGKNVVILPDNDPAGQHYADEVARLCREVGAASIRVLRLADYATGLPVGGDVADIVASPDWCGLPLGDAAEVGDFAKWLSETAKKTELLQSLTVLDDEADAVDDWAFQPFPVDALPEPVRAFVVNGARAIGCDVSYLALPLLTAIAAAIGNTRRLELKRGWSVPPILWGAIVGESGTAKTPAFQLVLRPVRERQRKALERHAEEMKRYEADLARWEKDMADWRRDKDALSDPPEKPTPPRAERFIVSDTTVEALAPILLDNPRGLLLARDELAGWIGSFDRYAGQGKSGADLASWLSMFNAESIIVDRKTGTPRTIHVPQAAVCVSGGIQPAILQRALSLELRESGLAARLLLAYPPRKVKRWTEAGIDPIAEAKLARLFGRLYELQPAVGDDGEPRPVVVHLSDEAKAAWIAYYNAHAAEQADLTGDMASAWSKLEEYAARLALVVHYVRWAAGDVVHETQLDVASMTAGIRLAAWFKHEARRVYAMLDESDAERDRRRLIEWIERKGGTVTAREVQQGCRWLKDPGAAEAALEELVKAGRGSWEQSPPGQRGRPTRRFRLSTVSTVYENTVFPEKNCNFVDVDNVDAADSVDADSVDAAKTESPTPTPAASTVYEIPAKPAVYEISKKPEESGVFVDVDNVDDSSRPYPGGRLFPEPQQLPD